MAQGNPNFTVTIVVTGNPVTLEANPNAPLESLFEKSLNAANVPPPHDASKWLFKDSAGNVFDRTKKLIELGLGAGSTIFLSLEAGAAG